MRGLTIPDRFAFREAFINGFHQSASFFCFVEETVELLRPLPIADGGFTHVYPWMGAFNVLQWTWPLAGHSGIHLAQLQAIKKGL